MHAMRTSSLLANHRLNLIISILVAWLSSVQVWAQVAEPQPPPVQFGLVHSANGTDSLQSSPTDNQSETTSSSISLAGNKQLVFAPDYAILSIISPSNPNSNSPTPLPAITQDPHRLKNATTMTYDQEIITTTMRSSTFNESLQPTMTSEATTSTTTSSSTAASSASSLLTSPGQVPETNSQQSNAPPSSPVASAQPQPQPYCTLGDDTYQIGERWNPNLPPFGVQVCVLCECTVRQKKYCYEAKVTCRRITNECPVIDSCPDGKKPVTVAGQCCKSCQSTSVSLSPSHDSNMQAQQQQSPQSIGNLSPTYESQPQLKPMPTTSFRIVYMNERTKDYMSLVENLPACPMRDSDGVTKSPSQVPASVPTTMAPMQAPSANNNKASKSNRNDLNGIDTRLAFKSLHDATSNHIGSSKSRYSSSDTSATMNQQHESSSPRRFDHSSDDHQHPNDVQSATASNRNHPQHSISASYGSAGTSSRLPPASSCKLGNDTFQVGDVWNPILPPLGVQVCVQCNCIFRIRKGCYETKVTCRRINRDCPILDSCPDGNSPINVDGQCCKTCPTSLETSNDQEPTGRAANLFQPTTLPLDGIMRNEKVYREFYALTRNLNMCVKSKESVDIYNTSRYARRSRQA